MRFQPTSSIPGGMDHYLSSARATVQSVYVSRVCLESNWYYHFCNLILLHLHVRSSRPIHEAASLVIYSVVTIRTRMDLGPMLTPRRGCPISETTQYPQIVISAKINANFYYFLSQTFWGFSRCRSNLTTTN